MRVLKLSLSILLVGCASSRGASPPTDRVLASDDRTGETLRTINDAGAVPVTLAGSAKDVAKAVELTYIFLKIPITYNDESTMTQGNQRFVMSRTFDHQPVSYYVSCGADQFGAPTADSNPVTVSVMTRARAISPTQTALETTVTGSTYKPGASGAIYCASTGTLEHHIAEMVASRLSKTQ
jgi:hypothetical protein